MTLSRVLLPLPLPPTRPTASPSAMSKLMSRSAQNVSDVVVARPWNSRSRSCILRRREV